MSKIGIMEKEEGKFFASIISEQIPVKGVAGVAIKMVLPMFLNGLDDKLGDKIPEPWQSLMEDLTTSLYIALQDKVVTEEEADEMLDKCAMIINQEIDLPLLEESDELEAFMFLLKFIASQVKVWIKKSRGQ